MRTATVWTALAATAIILTGCSGKPADADITPDLPVENAPQVQPSDGPAPDSEPADSPTDVISTDCTAADFPNWENHQLGPAHCMRHFSYVTVSADGVVVAFEESWFHGDALLEAHGEYELSDAATPAQWVAQRNAPDPQREAYVNDTLAEPIYGTDLTVGDVVTFDEVAGSYELIDHVIVVRSFNGARAMQPQVWSAVEMSVNGDEVTIVGEVYGDGAVPGGSTSVWNLPGEIIETNGDVDGTTVSWDAATTTRAFVTFRGLNDQALAAIADTP